MNRYTMKAVAEIQDFPIGVGVSARAQVRRAQDLIRESVLVVPATESQTH